MRQKKNLWVVMIKNLLTKKTSTMYSKGSNMLDAHKNAQEELDEKGDTHQILSVLQR